MKRVLVISAISAALLLVCTSAFADGFIDFENGYDGQIIYSSIPGLEFTNTEGYDWLYADWRTNGYNGCYPNYSIIDVNPLDTQYFSNGNFFAWLGTDQGRGIITFTQSYATYFQLGYSVYYDITLSAYDDSGNLLDQDMGTQNVGTGQLGTLRVEAGGMAYVEVYGTGNYWLIDDIETDALQECTNDSECDDGDYCNGEESCVNFQCQDGTPITCEDDGMFCNGEEVCKESSFGCGHTGNPCEADQTCNEVTDSCDEDDAQATDDDTVTQTEDEEAGWPEGEVTGGCCGN